MHIIIGITKEMIIYHFFLGWNKNYIYLQNKEIRKMELSFSTANKKIIIYFWHQFQFTMTRKSLYLPQNKIKLFVPFFFVTEIPISHRKILV